MILIYVLSCKKHLPLIISFKRLPMIVRVMVICIQITLTSHILEVLGFLSSSKFPEYNVEGVINLTMDENSY